MSNKIILYIGIAAFLIGSVVGGLVVDKASVCPPPPNFDPVVDSLSVEVYNKKIEMDGLLVVIANHEAKIKELQAKKIPTPIRVANAKRYYSSAGVDELDSLLRADPED